MGSLWPWVDPPRFKVQQGSKHSVDERDDTELSVS